MKQLTSEWIAKAEGDFASAQREWRARKQPNYDASCFHSQQCVEKYLKAYLQELDVVFPKTHDLVQLLDLTPGQPGLVSLRDAFAILTSYAVELRYPGESASKQAAKHALDWCRSARSEIRSLLHLD